MSNNFKNAEEVSKQTFLDFVVSQDELRLKRFTEGDYDPYDVVYYTGSTLTIGEIKKRNYNHNTYNDWFMQEDKLIKMLEIKNSSKYDVKVTYINHFKDGVTLIWDLTSIDLKNLKTFKKQLPINSFTTETILKTVINLPIHLAKRYK